MLKKLLGIESYFAYTKGVATATKLFEITRSYDGIAIYLWRYELHVSRTR